MAAPEERGGIAGIQGSGLSSGRPNSFSALRLSLGGAGWAAWPPARSITLARSAKSLHTMMK